MMSSKAHRAKVIPKQQSSSGNLTVAKNIKVNKENRQKRTSQQETLDFLGCSKNRTENFDVKKIDALPLTCTNTLQLVFRGCMVKLSCVVDHSDPSYLPIYFLNALW